MSYFVVDSLTINFKMISENNTFPYWFTPEPHISIRHVPGGNSEVVQNMGRGARRITFQAMLDNSAEYDDLAFLLGQLGTIRLRGDEEIPAILTNAGEDTVVYVQNGEVIVTLSFREG